jgi:hypothetical protein
MEFCDSNALFAEDSIPQANDQIRSWFYQILRDSKGRIIQRMQDALEGPPRLSRYTVSPPSADKWHSNVAALGRVLPDLKNTIELIQSIACELPKDEFGQSIKAAMK